MTTQNYFDLAKKRIEGGLDDDGYIAMNGKTYNAYKTRAQWEEYKEGMKCQYNQAYREFKNGDGGELNEGRYPPKMASYGSSSRMLFELARDIPGFHFEEKLGICVPSNNESQEAKASLDGYLKDKCLYVEAKCREIYVKNHFKFNPKYKEFYDFLTQHTNGLFHYSLVESQRSTDKVKNRIVFSYNGIIIRHLDLKQLLCHLLGIAKKALNDGGKHPPTLLYLVYRPTNILLESVMSKRAKNSILRCLGTEKVEAELISFELLYKYTVRFVHERFGIGKGLSMKELDGISNAFVFRLCDQEDFLSYIQ